MRLCDSPRDRLHLGSSLPFVDAWLEPREDSEEPGIALGAEKVVAQGNERNPDLRLKVRKSKSAGHDSDDGVPVAIELQGFADYFGVATESSFPQFVAQNNNLIMAGLILSGEDGSAERGCDAENMEEIRRNAGTCDSLRTL